MPSNALTPPPSKRPVDLNKYVDRYNGGHNFGVLAAKLNAKSDPIMILQLKKVKNSLEYIPYGGQYDKKHSLNLSLVECEEQQTFKLIKSNDLKALLARRQKPSKL